MHENKNYDNVKLKSFDFTVEMKKLIIALIFPLAFMCSCGSKNGSGAHYPDNFDKIGDIERVKYMMERVAPDSLARFVINSALGLNPGAPIDSLALATLYIYDNLKDTNLETFSVEYDAYIETLPLEEKMKVYMLGGSEDPQKLGYKLGLEYLGSIRENNKNVEQVEKELKAFKKACGSDTAMYRRFIIGFHTVLDVDKGVDTPGDIYRKFRNYE